MDAAVKKKWLEGLRSGDYKQTAGALRENETGGEMRYCCLGVLCDVLGEREWTPQGSSAFAYGRHTESNTWALGSVPTVIRDRIGLSKEEETELIDMNDSDYKTFLEIADWIEENL